MIFALLIFRELQCFPCDSILDLSAIFLLQRPMRTTLVLSKSVPILAAKAIFLFTMSDVKRRCDYRTKCFEGRYDENSSILPKNVYQTRLVFWFCCSGLVQVSKIRRWSQELIDPKRTKFCNEIHELSRNSDVCPKTRYTWWGHKFFDLAYFSGRGKGFG